MTNSSTPSEPSNPDSSVRGYRVRVEYPGILQYRYGAFSAEEGWFTTAREVAHVFDTWEKAQVVVIHLKAELAKTAAQAIVLIEERPSFDPDWCTPPAGTIRELMEHHQLPEPQAAERLGLSLQDMTGLLSGDLPINEPLSHRLFETFGGSPSYWQALDANYREGIRMGRTVIR